MEANGFVGDCRCSVCRRPDGSRFPALGAERLGGAAAPRTAAPCRVGRAFATAEAGGALRRGGAEAAERGEGCDVPCLVFGGVKILAGMR